MVREKTRGSNLPSTVLTSQPKALPAPPAACADVRQPSPAKPHARKTIFLLGCAAGPVVGPVNEVTGSIADSAIAWYCDTSAVADLPVAEDDAPPPHALVATRQPAATVTASAR